MIGEQSNPFDIYAQKFRHPAGKDFCSIPFVKGEARGYGYAVNRMFHFSCAAARGHGAHRIFGARGAPTAGRVGRDAQVERAIKGAAARQSDDAIVGNVAIVVQQRVQSHAAQLRPIGVAVRLRPRPRAFRAHVQPIDVRERGRGQSTWVQ